MIELLLPATGDLRDVAWVAYANGLPVADRVVLTADNRVQFFYRDGDPAVNVAALQSAVDATPRPPNAPWRIERTLEDALATSMAAMQQIIDTADIPAGTLTTAQLSNHVRALQTAVKAEARLLRRLVRAVRADYTGSD
jgi:hypothetical protein